MQGKIIKALAGFYYVESDGQVYQTRARGNFSKKGQIFSFLANGSSQYGYIPISGVL